VTTIRFTKLASVRIVAEAFVRRSDHVDSKMNKGGVHAVTLLQDGLAIRYTRRKGT
jgi:hypothetical protein